MLVPPQLSAPPTKQAAKRHNRPQKSVELRPKPPDSWPPVPQILLLISPGTLTDRYSLASGIAQLIPAGHTELTPADGAAAQGIALLRNSQLWCSILSCAADAASVLVYFWVLMCAAWLSGRCGAVNPHLGCGQLKLGGG